MPPALFAAPVDEDEDSEDRPAREGSVDRKDEDDAAADGESDLALETDPNC